MGQKKRMRSKEKHAEIKKIGERNTKEKAGTLNSGVQRGTGTGEGRLSTFE